MTSPFKMLLLLAIASVLGFRPCTCRADCPTAEIPVHAGIPDEFVLPTEPTAPSLELLSYMISHWPQPPTRQFDTQGNDLALIHTFTGWSGPVCGARLELRLAACTSSLSSNDGIWLTLIGGTDLFHAFVYRTTIANVVGSWGPGSVQTVELDLGALPVFEDYPTNVLDSLSDGALELLVEDDTAVDYAILFICICPTPVEATTWTRLKALQGVAPGTQVPQGEER